MHPNNCVICHFSGQQARTDGVIPQGVISMQRVCSFVLGFVVQDRRQAWQVVGAEEPQDPHLLMFRGVHCVRMNVC